MGALGVVWFLVGAGELYLDEIYLKRQEGWGLSP
jgi:hypothetical protein